MADPGISKPGDAIPERQNIWVRGLFDEPSNIPLFFFRILNEIHTVNIDCRLQVKYMRVTQSKFTKTNPEKFQTEVGGACPASAFDMREIL